MESSDTSQSHSHGKRSYSSLPKITSSSRDSGHSSRKHLHSLRDPNHKHHRHSRQHTKEKIASGIELHNPLSLTDIARAVNKSIEHASTSTETGSRRGSFSRIEEEQFIGPRPVPVRPEDATKEHIRNQAREDELRGAISELMGVALSTTRQLDDTYYSILEHITNLRSTISALQELSKLAKQLKHNFDEDAEELEQDIQGQIDGLSGFSAAQEKIEEFEERVKLNKDKAKSLDERLTAARQKVAERERLNNEWQARVSRRLRIVWAILGTMVGIFVLLLLVHNFRDQIEFGQSPGIKTHHTLNLANVSIPPPVQEILESLQKASKSRTWSTPKKTPSLVDTDPRLRILDEL